VQDQPPGDRVAGRFRDGGHVPIMPPGSACPGYDLVPWNELHGCNFPWGGHAAGCCGAGHADRSQITHVAAPGSYPPGHLQTYADLIEEAVRRLDAVAGACALVTASPAGIDAAHAIGIQPIGYAVSARDREHLAEAGPACVIPNLADLALATRHRVRRSPRRALPWRARPARPRRPQPVGAADLPRIFVTACGTTAPPSSSLSLVQLPAAASRASAASLRDRHAPTLDPAPTRRGSRLRGGRGMEQSNAILPDLAIHDRPGQRLSDQSRAVSLV